MLEKAKKQPSDSEQEIERLNIQSKTWEPDAFVLLDKIGIQPGWKAADLGCGPCGILAPLSQRVGEQGKVWGVDSNSLCLRATKKFVQNHQLRNVKLLQGDFYAPELKPHSFDLIHVRFVFTHQGCDLKLLDQMVNLTREGGTVISQESDWSTWNCYPASVAWERMREALIQTFELEGGNINAGQRNYQMLRNAGLVDVKMRSSVLALPVGHPYRTGMNRLARSLRNRMLDAGILQKAEFDELINECDLEMANPDVTVISYLLSQVWGRVGK
jgi:ubiquinone/menaquinone biosynthesis C-methylase UbiE